MRFDDRLKTVLRQRPGSSGFAVVQWRQLVDILAQHPRDFAAEDDIAAGLSRISELDDAVPADVQAAVLRDLSGRLRSPSLLMLLTARDARLCAEAIAAAALSDEEWARLIPELSSRARGFLRNRDDLGPLALEMLDRWRSSDFRLCHWTEEAREEASEPVEQDEAASVAAETAEDEAAEPIIAGPPPPEPQNEPKPETAGPDATRYALPVQPWFTPAEVHLAYEALAPGGVRVTSRIGLAEPEAADAEQVPGDDALGSEAAAPEPPRPERPLTAEEQAMAARVLEAALEPEMSEQARPAEEEANPLSEATPLPNDENRLPEANTEPVEQEAEDYLPEQALPEQALPEEALPKEADSEPAATTAGEPADIAQLTAKASAAGRQIRDLLDRISTFQRERQEKPPEQGEESRAAPARRSAPERLAFATDDAGTLIDVTGGPRGAVVGVSIAEPAFDDLPGPDAYAAAAFAQRMPIRNARMRLYGAESISGDWRLTADPIFDEESGRFRGYRGEMRRPTSGEDAAIAPLREDEDRADRLQQLLHELRTPLNAIIGFGEIIEQQLFGPVSTEYRELAGSVLEDARRLLSGFDDLSLAAKFDHGALDIRQGKTTGEWLFERMRERLQSVTDMREVELNLNRMEPVRPFALDQSSVERIFTRLVSAIVLASETGDSINGHLRTVVDYRPLNSFRIELPANLRHRDQDELFAAGSEGDEPHSEQAPLLGLGFSLRLVRNLARDAGGDLRFLKGDLILQLPATSVGDAKTI